MRWLIFILLLAVPARGAEYHVSRFGNDAADGLTPGTAWQTVDRVNKADLKPGDAVYFDSEDVFRGTLVIRRSGEKGKPILFSGRGGAGIDARGNPVCIDIAADHVVVDGFVLHGAADVNRGALAIHADRDLRDIAIWRCVVFDNSTRGMYVDADKGKTVRQLRILSNTIVSDSGTGMLIQCAEDSWIYGNAIQMNTQPRIDPLTALSVRSGRVRNVVIENNRIAAGVAGACGIRLHETGTGLVVKDNYIHVAADAGIALEDTPATQVSNNIVLRSPTGVRVSGGWHDHTITHNTVAAYRVGIAVERAEPIESRFFAPEHTLTIAKNLILVASGSALRVTDEAERSRVVIRQNRFDPPHFRWGDNAFETLAGLEDVIGDTESLKSPVISDGWIPTLASDDAGTSQKPDAEPRQRSDVLSRRFLKE